MNDHLDNIFLSILKKKTGLTFKFFLLQPLEHFGEGSLPEYKFTTPEIYHSKYYLHFERVHVVMFAAEIT